MKRGQVGGASFGMLPITTGDEQARKNTIVAKIKAKFKDSGSVLTSLLNIADTGIFERSPTSPTSLYAWFTVIEHQDELFDLVLEIIKETTKFEQKNIYDVDVIDKINREHPKWWKYIESIFNLIRLEGSVKDTRDTKMELLKGMEVIKWLQFPKRLNNIFVQSLANVFILMKHDKQLLEKIKALQIRTVALDEYRANIYANTYALTSHYPIDGYYMDQSLEEIKGIQANDAFWSGLFDALAVETTDTLNLLDANTKWTVVAAAVFNWYKDPAVKMDDYRASLFTYFNSRTTKGPEPARARTDSTDVKYDKVQVYGIPFIEILKAMDIPTLEFILHLAYTISKNEESTIAAINASDAE
jgi:hypothetical protein